MSTRCYDTDLNDAAWAWIAPYLPTARSGGRPRTTDLRTVLNAIFYLPRTGWGLSSSGTESRMSASFWSKSVAGGCPMLGQDRDNDIARVQQDGSVLLCRELDEAQSPEQEKSFNGQQSVTNVMGIA